MMLSRSLLLKFRVLCIGRIQAGKVVKFFKKKNQLSLGMLVLHKMQLKMYDPHELILTTVADRGLALYI